MDPYTTYADAARRGVLESEDLLPLILQQFTRRRHLVPLLAVNTWWFRHAVPIVWREVPSLLALLSVMARDPPPGSHRGLSPNTVSLVEWFSASDFDRSRLSLYGPNVRVLSIQEHGSHYTRWETLGFILDLCPLLENLEDVRFPLESADLSISSAVEILFLLLYRNSTCTSVRIDSPLVLRDPSIDKFDRVAASLTERKPHLRSLHILRPPRLQPEQSVCLAAAMHLNPSLSSLGVNLSLLHGATVVAMARLHQLEELTLQCDSHDCLSIRWLMPIEGGFPRLRALKMTGDWGAQQLNHFAHWPGLLAKLEDIDLSSSADEGCLWEFFELLRMKALDLRGFGLSSCESLSLTLHSLSPLLHIPLREVRFGSELDLKNAEWSDLLERGDAWSSSLVRLRSAFGCLDSTAMRALARFTSLEDVEMRVATADLADADPPGQSLLNNRSMRFTSGWQLLGLDVARIAQYCSRCFKHFVAIAPADEEYEIRKERYRPYDVAGHYYPSQNTDSDDPRIIPVVYIDLDDIEENMRCFEELVRCLADLSGN